MLTTTSEFQDVTAVILAGGLGTRLRSVVNDRPKVLAEVAGKPFLAQLLSQIRQVGVRHCVLCTGYMAEQIREEFGEEFEGIQLQYSEEQMLLGTAGALRFALPLCRSNPLLVLNGDSYCEADLGAFLHAHKTQNAIASLYLTEVENTFRYGRVVVDERGKIQQFEEKGATEGPGLINAGIYLLQTEVLHSVPKGKQVSLEREVFPSLLGAPFIGFQGSRGVFIDIGTPESYQRADVLFRTKEARL